MNNWDTEVSISFHYWGSTIDLLLRRMVVYCKNDQDVHYVERGSYGGAEGVR